MARVERLAPEGLAANQWPADALAQRLKTDPLKAELARKLRRESVMTLGWIGLRLTMGSVNTVLNALHSVGLNFFMGHGLALAMTFPAERCPGE